MVVFILLFFQVADTILLVHKAGEDISEQGSFILDCLMAQGLPTTLHLVQVLSRHSPVMWFVSFDPFQILHSPPFVSSAIVAFIVACLFEPNPYYYAISPSAY